ncbi:unnamed protein product, partial [Sphenostylis stenocarpa]
YSKKSSYDPIDYEYIDQIEFWVIEKEMHGELDIDELKNVSYHSIGFAIVESSQNNKVYIEAGR